MDSASVKWEKWLLSHPPQVPPHIDSSLDVCGIFLLSHSIKIFLQFLSLFFALRKEKCVLYTKYYSVKHVVF